MTPDEHHPTEIVSETADAAAAPRAGSPVVDRYRVLQRIGAGGMGEVWVAEQVTPIRRPVALKVIKPGMDSAEVVARFESERQALAMMGHPAIARVFDAGTTDQGRPFFAMELVRGVPITRHCDTHRLVVRERLELFTAVCEGVQHAHQKAIIHRDLKPSNVLVTVEDGHPTPKIIDFGVAKATAQRLTDNTVHTMLGQMVGTLEYMSPEQVELTGQDVDTRADIYSLGVMLYELLTGELPFEGRALRRQSYDDIRRTLRERDPARPSQRVAELEAGRVTAVAERRRTDPAGLIRKLRGDLDWITMKALDKDRTRRYGSASELAADIRRHLADEPILASPPSTLYRVRKAARRHRAAVLTASVVGLALVLGLLAATAGFVDASRERDRKERALEEARAVTGFLTDMLTAVDPSRSGREVSVRQVLDEVSVGLGDAFDDQPLVEAQLRQAIGSSYAALGVLDAAGRHLDEALDIRRGQLGDDHPDTLGSAVAVADLLAARGRYAEAETLHRGILATRRRTLGADHPDVVRSLHHLANVHFQQGRFEEAAELHRRVVGAFEAALGPDDPETLFAVANLASDYWALGRLDEAEPLSRRVLEVRTRTLGPDHPATIDVLNNLAALYHLQGRLGEAEPLYRRAVELGSRVRGPEHPETLVSTGNLAELWLDAGRLGEAAPLLEEVVRARRRVLGADHPDTLYSLAIMARLHERADRPEAAAETWNLVLESRRRTLGPDHPDTAAALDGVRRTRPHMAPPGG